MVTDMVAEMRAYYDRLAEVEELDRRIARLQDRLKSGDPDLTTDEPQAIIGKAVATRAELLAARPEAKRMDTIFRALPAVAAQYRTQTDKGL
jgi:hypothetical protein